MDDRLTQDELAGRLNAAAQKVTVGAEYGHYKGAKYHVLHLALLEVNNEPCVVYQALYGQRIIFVRPVSSWLEQVEVSGQLVPRFAKVS